MINKPIYPYYKLHLERNKSHINDILSNAWACRRKQDYLEALQFLEAAKKVCKPNDYGSLGRIYHINMQIALDQEELEKSIRLL